MRKWDVWNNVCRRLAAEHGMPAIEHLHAVELDYRDQNGVQTENLEQGEEFKLLVDDSPKDCFWDTHIWPGICSVAQEIITENMGYKPVVSMKLKKTPEKCKVSKARPGLRRLQKDTPSRLQEFFYEVLIRLEVNALKGIRLKAFCYICREDLRLSTCQVAEATRMRYSRISSYATQWDEFTKKIPHTKMEKELITDVRALSKAAEACRVHGKADVKGRMFIKTGGKARVQEKAQKKGATVNLNSPFSTTRSMKKLTESLIFAK